MKYWVGRKFESSRRALVETCARLEVVTWNSLHFCIEFIYSFELSYQNLLFIGERIGQQSSFYSSSWLFIKALLRKNNAVPITIISNHSIIEALKTLGQKCSLLSSYFYFTCDLITFFSLILLFIETLLRISSEG